MGTKFIKDNEYYCTICGNKGINIVRIKGREREAGHLKKLFCLTCQRDTNHTECVPNTKYTKEDFFIEYNYHNFDENGNRIRTYSELRRMINNGEIKETTNCDVRDPRLRKEYLDQEP